jgi:hypothetical protein
MAARQRNVSKQTHSADPESRDTSLDLSHMRRDVRTALELAVVAMAPADIIDRLGASAGLLEALVELPIDSAPVVALVPKVTSSTRSALEDWQKWRHEHLEKKMPRG